MRTPCRHFPGFTHVNQFCHCLLAPEEQVRSALETLRHFVPGVEEYTIDQLFLRFLDQNDEDSSNGRVGAS